MCKTAEYCRKPEDCMISHFCECKKKHYNKIIKIMRGNIQIYVNCEEYPEKHINYDVVEDNIDAFLNMCEKELISMAFKFSN